MPRVDAALLQSDSNALVVALFDLHYLRFLTLFGVGARTLLGGIHVKFSVVNLVALAMGIMGKNAESVGWGVVLGKRLGDVDL